MFGAGRCWAGGSDPTIPRAASFIRPPGVFRRTVVSVLPLLVPLRERGSEYSRDDYPDPLPYPLPLTYPKPHPESSGSISKLLSGDPELRRFPCAGPSGQTLNSYWGRGPSGIGEGTEDGAFSRCLYRV